MDGDIYMYNATLPISGAVVSFNDFTNDEYRKYIKILMNGDDNKIIELYKYILEKNIFRKTVNNLSFIDSFCALLEYYSYSVDDFVELSFKNADNSTVKYKFLITDIIKKLKQINFVKEIQIKNRMIKLAPPTNIKIDNGIDLLFNFVNSVNNTHPGIANFQSFDNSDILLKIPAGFDIDNEISKYINDINEQLQKILNINGFKLSINDNSFYYLMKIIWNQNLSSYFSKILAITTNSKVSADYLSKVSPVETDVILNIVKDIIKESNKDNKHNKMKPISEV